MEHVPPLCLVTGATPLKDCRFSGWANRSRSEPMLASSRGASTGPAPGEGFEDRALGVLLKNFGDLLIELLKGLEQELEFFAEQLHAQRGALEQSQLVGQWHRFVDAFQTLLDERLAAGALEVVELFEGFFAAFFSLW